MWLRCCRRLLRGPWTARRSNQSILKEINPEYSLEGLMLKLQHFGHLMGRASSLEKTPMLGRIEGRRRRNRGRDGLMASPIQWTWTWANSGKWWGTGKPGVLQSMGSQRIRHYLATEQNNNNKWSCVTNFFYWDNVFRVHSSCSRCQDFIPFFCWIVFHCIYVLHLFIHPSTDRCLGCFHFLETFHAISICCRLTMYIHGLIHTYSFI